MIDSKGYRLNVGIILINDAGQVFWARRVRQHGWQFPQGGIQAEESLESALYRELQEETGLAPEDVTVLAITKNWLTYELPKHFMRHDSKPLCIGQKQKWFLLKLNSEENKINLKGSHNPEFDTWCWIDYWSPLTQVIDFKKAVYQQTLEEFAPIVTTILKIDNL